MTRNKKLAKRIGCGLLAGSLAFSGMGIIPMDIQKVQAKSWNFVYYDSNNNPAFNTTYAGSSSLYKVVDGKKYELTTSGEYLHDELNFSANGVKWDAKVVKLIYTYKSGSETKTVSEYCAVELTVRSIPASNGVKKLELPSQLETTIYGKKQLIPIIDLGTNAFEKCVFAYEEVFIPSTFVKISDGAFKGCTTLQNVYFTNEDGTYNQGTNLQEIGDSAFEGCTSLKTAYLPKELISTEMNDSGTYAKDGAVIGTRNRFGTSVYRDCLSITQIEIDGDNVTIPCGTFAGCKNLKSVKFNTNTKSVIFGESAFSDTAITELNCPFDVGISGYAFSGCSQLHKVVFGGNVEIVGLNRDQYGSQGYWFTNAFDSSGEASIEFKGNGKVYLPQHTFDNAYGLKTIEFADSIEEIDVGSYAFANTGLTKLNIGGKNSVFDLYSMTNLGNISEINVNSKNSIKVYGGAFGSGITPDVVNIILKKITLDAPYVYFKGSAMGSGTRYDAFAQVGENTSLVFGENVKEIDGTVGTYLTSYGVPVGYGYGQMKNIYITSSETEVATDSMDYIFGMYSGYSGNLYGFPEKNYSTYKNYKNYIEEIEVEPVDANSDNVTFIAPTGFSEDRVVVKAKVANSTERIIVPCSKKGTNGYTCTMMDKVDLTTLTAAKKVDFCFEYGGATKTIGITVKPREVDSFTISVKEGKQFVEGTELDKTAFDISNIVYNDGVKETTSVNSEDISVALTSGNDKLVKGKNKVTVTYKGKSIDTEIDAVEKSVTTLTATLRDPNKAYYAGSTLTSDDFVVTAEYNNKEKKENFKDFTVSTNVIPDTVTAGTPYVVKISAGNASTEIALNISIPKVSGLIASYAGDGVLEGDSVDKNKVKVIAIYNNLSRAELKSDEYMLVYEPIVADVQNQVKVIYLADTAVMGNFEVTGLKRTQYDPTAAPSTTPTLLPTTAPSTEPTAVPTATPTATPAVSTTPAPTVDVPVPATATPVPATEQPATSVPATATPVPATEQPVQTVTPDVVPNTGATKLKANKYTLGLKEKVTISLTGGNATSFVSSNSKVATVTSKGVVKATKVGTTTVYVTDEFGVIKSVKITVKKAPKSVKASVKKKTLKVGKKFTIKAKFTKGYYSNKITFTSSNKKVATVNKSGTILAKKKGKTTITLKTFNGKKVKVTVTVK